MLEIGEWWLALEAIGLATLPICAWLFRGLRDQGYAVSKLLGIFLLLLLTWAYSFFSHVTWPIIVFFLVIISLISAYLLISKRVKIDKKMLIRMELVFIIVFLLFVGLRSFSPDYNPYGEKFMDYGMTHALQRDSTWPPYDPWFAGEPQHYYYFGYMAVSNLATLSGVPLSYGINLAVATLAALTFTACFGLGYNATGSRKFGIICAIMVIFIANLFGFFQIFGPPLINLYPDFYEPVEQFLVSYDPGHPWMIPGMHIEGYPGYIDFNSAMVSPLNPGGPVNLMGFVDDSVASIGHFSYWTSSRIIPYTINEFPLFSFLHADMHAHVINMPFQILALTFIAGFLLVPRRPRWECIVFLGMLVGVMFGIDSWEFPAYAAISFGAIGLAFIKNEKWSASGFRNRLKTTILPFSSRLGLFTAVTLLTMLPFYLLFASGREIGIVEIRTELIFFLIINGLFLAVMYSFLLRFSGLRVRTVGIGMAWMAVVSYLAIVGYGEGGFTYQLLAVVLVAAGLVFIWVKGIQHHWSLLSGCLWGMSITISFVIDFQLLFLLVPLIAISAANLIRCRDRLQMLNNLLILAGGAVALFCEVLYIQDAMGSRFNTVFKMYIQIWVFWGIATGLSLYDFRYWFRSRARFSNRVWAVAIIILILMASIYVLPAMIHRSHDFQAEIPTSQGKFISPTLDGLAYIREVYPEEYYAIQYLDGIPGTPVLLEATGDPYSYSSPVSTFSGLPTLVGWGFHEINWRDNSTLIQQRIEQCRNMYQYENLTLRLEMMSSFDIEYVYVGHLEEKKYGNDVHENFDNYPETFIPVYNRSVYNILLDGSFFSIFVDSITGQVVDAWVEFEPDISIELTEGNVLDGMITLTVYEENETTETIDIDLNTANMKSRSTIYIIEWS